MNDTNFVYAGFWIRTLATMLDTIIVAMITWPILYAIYGESYLMNDTSPHTFLQILIEWVFPITATIIFWVTKSATPGKMILSIKVLDARTGNPMTVNQSIGRYFAYIFSILPVMIGFIWVAFDSRKQAFHDKLANTVVVRDSKAELQPVKFDNQA